MLTRVQWFLGFTVLPWNEIVLPLLFPRTVFAVSAIVPLQAGAPETERC